MISSNALLDSFLTKLQAPVKIGGRSLPMWAVISGGLGVLSGAGLGAATLLGQQESNTSGLLRPTPENEAEIDRRIGQFMRGAAPERNAEETIELVRQAGRELTPEEYANLPIAIWENGEFIRLENT